MKINIKNQITMVTVEKDSDCTATKAYLYDDEFNLLDTKTFSTNTATFNYTDLVV